MSGNSYRRVPYRPEEEEFVRTTEAGRRLGVKTPQVYQLIEEGVLRVAMDDRGRGYVPRSDVDDYLRHSA
jgi:excisionase family DNA binding protein